MMARVYYMRAKDSVTAEIYTWQLSTLDFSGAGYPGPNAATQLMCSGYYDDGAGAPTPAVQPQVALLAGPWSGDGDDLASPPTIDVGESNVWVTIGTGTYPWAGTTAEPPFTSDGANFTYIGPSCMAVLEARATVGGASTNAALAIRHDGLPDGSAGNVFQGEVSFPVGGGRGHITSRRTVYLQTGQVIAPLLKSSGASNLTLYQLSLSITLVP